jgi:hypothetical protein
MSSEPAHARGLPEHRTIGYARERGPAPCRHQTRRNGGTRRSWTARLGYRRRSEVRILFVFDPWRSAILLVTADKAGEGSRWYAEAISRGEQVYEIYLKDRAEEAAE